MYIYLTVLHIIVFVLPLYYFNFCCQNSEFTAKVSHLFKERISHKLIVEVSLPYANRRNIGSICNRLISPLPQLMQTQSLTSSVQQYDQVTYNTPRTEILFSCTNYFHSLLFLFFVITVKLPSVNKNQFSQKILQRQLVFNKS